MERSIVDFKQSNSIRKELISKNKSETNINKSNLIDFISNLKKFNLNSAFDHKGAKSFLKSKEKALKKIIIDENLYDEKSIESNKKKEECLNIPKIGSHQDLFRLNNKNKDKNQHYLTSLNDNKNKILNTTHDKEEKLISANEKEIINKKDKHLKIKKKSTQFYSQSELKMFNDKELKKLKPIKVKTFKNNPKYNSVYNKNTKVFKRIDNRPSNSTLITLINEMSN